MTTPNCKAMVEVSQGPLLAHLHCGHDFRAHARVHHLVVDKDLAWIWVRYESVGTPLEHIQGDQTIRANVRLNAHRLEEPANELLVDRVVVDHEHSPVSRGRGSPAAHSR